MSMFDMEETLCDRENNKCKRREKCQRYMSLRGPLDWEAAYWPEFGKLCEYFRPIPKPEKKNEVSETDTQN